MNNPVTSLSVHKLESLVQLLSQDAASLKQALVLEESQIDPTAPPTLGDDHHQNVLRAFEASQVALGNFERAHLDDPALVKDAQKAFLEDSNPQFEQSWIGQRARTKPHGFVGDYEMLIKLYDEKTSATGLGGYIDLCILDLPLARAVRTRLKAARTFLLEEIGRRSGKISILDVASGPCREYMNWPEFSDCEVEVVAMDTDPHALEHVQSNVCPSVPRGTTLRPVRYNALRTSVAEGTIRLFGKFDVIYSVGLCDYLTDDQLIRMFAAWKETLNDGGVMYVAFKDCEQYDHTPYQWHLDWFFYQRTFDDAKSLFAKAGIDTSEMEITRDETGIIINFIYRKPSASQHRIDAAEAITPNLIVAEIAAEVRSEV